MKSSKIKKFLSILILIPIVTFLASTLIDAQERNREHAEMFKELRKQLEEFKNSEIIPNLKKWKEQLDGAMTPEDLQELNKIREEADKLRKKFHSRILENKKSIKKEMDEERKHHRKRMKKQMKVLRKFGNDLKPLAKKYEETLKKIAEEAKAYSDEWKKISKEIYENWKEKNAEELEKLRTQHKMHMKRYLKSVQKFRELDMDLKKKLAAMKFMLWNGEDKGEEFENFFESKSDENLNIESTKPNPVNLSNSPNPFTDITVISFTLKNEEKIKLTITDNVGNVVSVIFEGRLPAGEHSYDFDANKNELSSGTYMYKLEASSGSYTGKMLFER